MDIRHLPYFREGGKTVPRKWGVSDVLQKMQEEKVRFIDLQFTDVPGRLQHVTVPVESLDEDSFKDGVPKTRWKFDPRLHRYSRIRYVAYT